MINKKLMSKRFPRKKIRSGLKSSILIVCVVLFGGLSACKNIFEDIAQVDTDEAIYYQARIYLADGKYSLALTEFERLSSVYQGRAEVVLDWATAHAGLCGLDFLGLIEAIEDIGTTNFFLLMMKQFKGTTATQAESCIDAEEKLQEISESAGGRDLDQNLLMVFIGFAKIGSLLAAYADTDEDGKTDSSFDACATGSMADSDMAQVASGFGNAVLSLTAISSDTDIGGDQMEDFDSGCSDLGDLGASYNFCELTDASDITTDQLTGVRSLINESELIGIGSCTGDLVACNCL